MILGEILGKKLGKMPVSRGFVDRSSLVTGSEEKKKREKNAVNSGHLVL